MHICTHTYYSPWTYEGSLLHILRAGFILDGSYLRGKTYRENLCDTIFSLKVQGFSGKPKIFIKPLNLPQLTLQMFVFLMWEAAKIFTEPFKLPRYCLPPSSLDFSLTQSPRVWGRFIFNCGWRKSYMAQNSLELKLPSLSSPPFYVKQRTLSPKEKNGH